MTVHKEGNDGTITSFLFTDGQNQYHRRYLIVRLSNRSEELLGIYLKGGNERGNVIKFVKRSEASVTRFIQSLKMAFNYLTTESEDDDGECYFYRNVIAKVITPKKTEATARRAKRINSQMLDRDEMEGLLDFVRNDYQSTLTLKQLTWFTRDYLRDLAILSLFQGICVNELAGLQLMDVDAKKNDISVLRKGSKEDTVSITPSAMSNLMAYL